WPMTPLKSVLRTGRSTLLENYKAQGWGVIMQVSVSKGAIMNSAFHIVCAWCHRMMRPAGRVDAPINHSICDLCFEVQTKAAKNTRSRSQVERKKQHHETANKAH